MLLDIKKTIFKIYMLLHINFETQFVFKTVNVELLVNCIWASFFCNKGSK